MYSKEVLLGWIDALEDVQEDLSEWEIGFVESVKYQLNRKGFLTLTQQERLENIYAKKTK